MVFTCTDPYETSTLVTDEQRRDMSSHFSTYPFDLSDFQKYALTSIVKGDHVLVTAHTGSGKTLPAEFAIKLFCSQGKKVIYTSPIKALSNQKFDEFRKQFPDISVGIITGDIKFNPEADIIIMTTEILRNNLYQRNQNIEPTNLHFEINIETELACVIFDEVHYINDADRGKVWEESIMMLPEHVQLVMLSATIDRADVFAKWCEDRYIESNKNVWLAPTNHRVVPLTHYNYIVTPDGFYKHEKNKEIQKTVRDYCGDFHVIRTSSGVFVDETANKTNKILQMIFQHRVRVTNEFVIESVLGFLKQRDMLPAIFFVFSRKNVERFAKNISISLFPHDSKIPSIVEHECGKILRKLPNHSEYTCLPEYHFIISCLKKGIAVHHSGIVPVFREMIEILFAKGFIRALFATETFAVGINMPTKTVVFTALHKYSDGGTRFIHSHEYTQMAGRAGRRGIDTVGNVIHLNNLMWGEHYPDVSTYKDIVGGTPQKLTSKFTINFDIILNMVDMGLKYTDLENYSNKSMLRGDLNRMLSGINTEITTLRETVKNSSNGIPSTDMEQIEQYVQLEQSLTTVTGNKRKKILKTLTEIGKNNTKFKENKQIFDSLAKQKDELTSRERSRDDIMGYFSGTINVKFNYLVANGYISIDNNEPSVTNTGRMTMLVREGPGLAMGRMINDPTFHEMTPIEMAGFISCFTNIRVSDDTRSGPPTCGGSITKPLSSAITRLQDIMTENMKGQMELGIHDIIEDPDVELHYDIIEEIISWSSCDDESTCITILNILKEEKGITTGEFIKAILKIVNVVLELQNACELIARIDISHKLSQIPAMMTKYIATSQSLYV